MYVHDICTRQHVHTHSFLHIQTYILLTTLTTDGEAAASQNQKSNFAFVRRLLPGIPKVKFQLGLMCEFVHDANIVFGLRS